MKILIIGNGALTKQDGSFYKDKHTANFLKNLTKVDSISYCGWLEPVISSTNLSENNLHGSELSSDIILLNTTPIKKGKINKLVDYLRLIKIFIFNINRYDNIYFFYHGNLSSLCAIFAIVFKKKYSLYIRCDFNPTSFIQKRIVKNASFILANGELFLDRVRSINKNSELVAPMIDFSKKDIFYNREFNFSKTINLLFVSRLEKAKGVFILLESIKNLKDKNINVFLDIVGDGEEFNTLNKLSNEYGLKEQVTFHGLIKDKDNLMSFYRKADLFIFPSYYPEGFPRVIYEAMLASLPIVTTEVGSISKLMKNEFNSLIIQKNNYLDLSSAIEKFIKEPDLSKKLSKNARETIINYLDRFDKPHYMQFIELLNRKL